MTLPASRTQFPDPVVTANVYCDHRLDEVIHSALAPLRQKMAERDTDGFWRLWFLRYPKRGNHLKVRLHGPEAAAPELRELLAEAVETCFAALPPPDNDEQRQESRGTPPIDAEDEVDSLHADRSFLWTRYRRSHISLGGKPLLDDDLYAALATTCLARGCEIVLSSLQPNGMGQFPHSPRQTTLLRMVVGGLGALDFGVDENAAYLSYHRDWLLRFMASKSKAGAEKIGQILAKLDEQVDGMGSALDHLRRMADDAWSEEGARTGLDGTDSGWWQALRDFRNYLDRFRGDPVYQLDPFATDAAFSPAFKVFHGCANQLGLNMLNEAFAYHLLLKAVAV